MIRIKALDHLVLTVESIERSVDFYSNTLGMRYQGNSLFFGCQKINLHAFPGEFQPAARVPAEGSADICLLCENTVEELLDALRDRDVAIELGPVPRNGAQGPMQSIYLRDPDGNLVELAVRC